MQPITLRFIFSYRDVLLPGLNIYIKRPIFWLLMLVSALCVGLSFFLAESSLTLLLIGLIGLVVPVSVFILSVLLNNRRLNRQEAIYTLSEKGIELQLPNTKQEQEWATVTRFIEHDEHYMLFCSRQRLHIIPKRAFSSPGQQQAFRALIAEQRPDLLKPTRNRQLRV